LSRRLDKVEEEELLRRAATRRHLPCLPHRAASPSSSLLTAGELRSSSGRRASIRTISF
jgi:hypothetical protein